MSNHCHCHPQNDTAQGTKLSLTQEAEPSCMKQSNREEQANTT